MYTDCAWSRIPGLLLFLFFFQDRGLLNAWVWVWIVSTNPGWRFSQCVLVTPAMGWRRPEDGWSPVASQPSLVDEFHVQRETASRDRQGRMASTQTHIYHIPCEHTGTQREKENAGKGPKLSPQKGNGIVSGSEKMGYLKISSFYMTFNLFHNMIQLAYFTFRSN